MLERELIHRHLGDDWDSGSVDDERERWWRRVVPRVAAYALGRDESECHSLFEAACDMFNETHPVRHQWLWEPPPGNEWPGYTYRTARGWEVLGEQRVLVTPRCRLETVLAVWGEALECWVSDLRAVGHQTGQGMLQWLNRCYPARCCTQGDAAEMVRLLVEHGVCERIGPDRGSPIEARLVLMGKQYANPEACSVYRPRRHAWCSCYG